jgi:DNA-binding transcriptional LysR family regulator
MEPNTFASALNAAAHDALSRIERGIVGRREFIPSTFAGEITFGCSQVSEAFLLPIIIGGLKIASPHISVRSVQPGPQEMVEYMEDGTIDPAISNFLEFERANLFQHRLFTTELACVLRVGHQQFVAGAFKPALQ